MKVSLDKGKLKLIAGASLWFMVNVWLRLKEKESVPQKRINKLEMESVFININIYTYG